MAKLAEYLVAEGMVDDISHEGLRALLREEGVSFQVIKTWKTSIDRDFEAKKNRVLELYDIADGRLHPGEGDPSVVFCMEKFGPLNLLPRPGKQWAPRAPDPSPARPMLPAVGGAERPTSAPKVSVTSWRRSSWDVTACTAMSGRTRT